MEIKSDNHGAATIQISKKTKAASYQKNKLELLGGIILIAIGVKILFEHLLN